MTEKESPFACDMNAIAGDQRNAHLATIDQVFRSVETIREIPNGDAFQLPNRSEMLVTVAEFIALERLCCPFFGFGVEVVREGGPVLLSLTGCEGVKPFILAEIGDHLPISLRSHQS